MNGASSWHLLYFHLTVSTMSPAMSTVPPDILMHVLPSGLDSPIFQLVKSMGLWSAHLYGEPRPLEDSPIQL